ncbi:MAG: hypothetical protein KDC80_01945 [Saprospiraceae bacterium]|nr:hypothetical protein [Saprospiraceae bacterium]
MRLLISGLLVCLIVSTSFRDALVVTAFRLHQDYIAANLCLNRNLEENMCHGSCQLKIKMDKNHESPASGLILLSEQLPITFYFQAQPHPSSYSTLLQKITPHFSGGFYFSSFLFRLFRPPRF